MSRWIYSKKDDCAYLALGKTGCSSILHVIGSALGLAVPGKNPHQWAWGDSARRLEVYAPAEGTYSFTFVRNPFDRLVSVWADKIKPVHENTQPVDPLYVVTLPGYPRGLSFADFAGRMLAQPVLNVDHHVQPQSINVLMHGIPRVQDVFRFETLAADFEKVRQRFNWPALPHKNASEHAHYHEFYSDSLRAKVEAYYKSDMDIFGYTF